MFLAFPSISPCLRLFYSYFLAILLLFNEINVFVDHPQVGVGFFYREQRSPKIKNIKEFSTFLESRALLTLLLHLSRGWFCSPLFRHVIRSTRLGGEWKVWANWMYLWKLTIEMNFNLTWIRSHFYVNLVGLKRTFLWTSWPQLFPLFRLVSLPRKKKGNEAAEHKKNIEPSGW